MEQTHMEETNQTAAPVVERLQGPVGSKKLAMQVLIALVVITAGVAVYFYHELKQLKQDPQKVAQQEAAELVATVGKLIVLPEGEQPTIATVTDPEKLKGQAFFDHAKTGDKVMIYTNAKKAILYSPSENKIVEVAPLSIGGTAGTNQ